MKNESTLLSNPQSKIAAYKLPMKRIMVNRTKGVAKCVIGTPIPGQRVIEKVLMVVGATGAGKTTLINGMINYFFGVKWTDDFRLVLIAEDLAKIQAHGQTVLITAYTIYPSEGSQFEYTLTIIDTPGFGDITDLERGKQIIQQMQDFFSVQSENGIDHLDGIGIVTQASLAQLTAQQNYIFHSILSVFGNDVEQNIFIMVTFADFKDPPVIAAIKKAKIQFSTYYKFNNSALFASNKHIQHLEKEKNEEEDFNEMFWNMGYFFLKNFFSAFYNKNGVGLYLTKEVIRERKQLETTTQAVKQLISSGCTKLEEFRQEERVLQQIKAEIEANKNYTYTIVIQKQRKIDLPTGHYITNCLTCNFTCHYNCIYADDKDKYQCSAMDNGGQSNAHCMACPKKCFWQQHVSSPYTFELYMDTEERSSEVLHEKYKTALQRKKKVENMVQQIEYSLQTVENGIIFKVEELQRVLQRLDKIALKQSPLTQVQYINLLIEAEKQQAKPGFQRRIEYYEYIKQHVKILEKAKHGLESLTIQKEEEDIKELNKKHQKSWFNPLKYW